jgi:hypothetical protein
MDWMIGAILRLSAFCMCAVLVSGCAAGKLAGAMMAADEAQKKIEVKARYAGLQEKTCAVVVESDAFTIYQFPQVPEVISSGVTARLHRDVTGSRFLSPQAVIDWQFRTSQWNSLPYGELAEQLNVDRIILINLLEYRLHPPGDRFFWEGVCIARVGIIERGGLDPDTFAETFDISAKFPKETGVTVESAPQAAIERGLLFEVVQKTAWLFHDHIEPKHPDKYRPELDRKN